MNKTRPKNYLHSLFFFCNVSVIIFRHYHFSLIMNTDRNNYQQIDDQPESPTSQTQETNDKNLNSEDDANQITSNQLRERKSSLIVIGLISVLTGKIF